jgi:hypothetical protein
MLDSINEEIKSWWMNRQQVWWLPIPNLIQRIKDWYYKTKECKLNLEIYNLADTGFKCSNLFEFITHYKLTENSDLKYPVIINRLWQVIDWRHRICNAIMLWIKEIDAIQILDSEVVSNEVEE